MERTIAANRCALDIGAKSKYAAENGNAVALRDSRPPMTSEKAPCNYSRSATGYVQESCVGMVKRSTYKRND